MQRVLLLALSVITAVAFAGCAPKLKKGECKSSADCASQEGVGKVCVEGRCQECGQDSDCQAGFVCRDNQCAPKPQCGPDTPCPAGQECVAERCVEKKAAAQPEAGAGAAGAAGAEAGAVPAECSDATSFTIRFDFDRYAITSASQQTLQKFADCLKRAPAKAITANGYADERGTAQYNVALSAKRAEAAKKYLGDLGVSGKIQTVGNGEESPLCTESNEACWSQNRRVEFQVSR
jgi:peptidoglycan-associated lipoprotein